MGPRGDGGDTRSDEEVYDLYLDACARGDADPPDRVFEQHPDLSEASRARIRSLYEALKEREAQPRDGALPRERIGEFRLLRPIDEGGMGQVFLAEQESLHRKVALKLVHPELRASATAVERFRREALAVARLRHPNIVQVIAAGEEEGERFLVMEYVEGESLGRRIARGAVEDAPPGVTESARWCREIAEALACAHDEGIIHRDVKPGNIHITPSGVAMLLDFGVARADDTFAGDLTTTFAGSPLYAAPEQLAGAAVDARTDIYGLGVTLYQCLTGRVPFAGGSLEQMIQRVAREDPVAPRRLNPQVSRDLEIVLLRALHKDPDRRFATAQEFADDLGRVLDREPIRSRPPTRVERTRKWVRAHPVAAGALGLVFALAALVAGLRFNAERVRGAEAQELVAQAADLADEYGRRGAEAPQLQRKLFQLQAARMERYTTPGEDRELERLEAKASQGRREHETLFYRVLELLRRAELLDPALMGTDRVRARLYVEKWREADAREDPDSTAFYRDLIERTDPGADVLGRLTGTRTLRIRTRAPGADVWLFRLVELARLVEGGARRVVPVPHAVEDPVPAPGTPCLRVVEPAGGLERGDLIDRLDGQPIRLVDVDARERVHRGGLTARVIRNGSAREMVLAPGARVRLTAIPLATSDGCHLGRTPLAPINLSAAPYLLIFRREGCLETRQAVYLNDVETMPPQAVWLPPRADVPPGFVAVSPGSEAGPFLIMEREVTAGEYLSFLNDPTTSPAVRKARVPRGGGSGGWDYWTVHEDRCELGAVWRPDFPIVGISHDDAVAFADWMTRRARKAGRGWTFRLPTFSEWVHASLGLGRFCFGSHFNPKWVSSCYSRPEAMIEPVLSYPIDESVSGLFDTTGGAREWVADWYDEGRGLRRFCGGSWAQANPEQFRVYVPNGSIPSAAGGELGLRLVVELE